MIVAIPGKVNSSSPVDHLAPVKCVVDPAGARGLSVDGAAGRAVTCSLTDSTARCPNPTASPATIGSCRAPLW